MRVEFLKAIDTVCKMSDINLRLSDIVEISEIQNSSDGDLVFLHCRNDKEMFEFKMSISMDRYSPQRFHVSVREVKDSPYSCDTFNTIVTV